MYTYKIYNKYKIQEYIKIQGNAKKVQHLFPLRPSSSINRREKKNTATRIHEFPRSVSEAVEKNNNNRLREKNKQTKKQTAIN